MLDCKATDMGPVALKAVLRKWPKLAGRWTKVWRLQVFHKN